MVTEAATNLRVVSQTYNADGDYNDVTFAWERGFSDEAITVTVFLDITLFPFDYTCGEPARICLEVGGLVQQWTVGFIGFSATHGWRINTLFQFQDGSQVWAPSPDQTFVSAARPSYTPQADNLLPVFTRDELSLLPSVILPENSRQSILPYFAPLVDRNNPGGGPTNPPGTPPGGGPPVINGDIMEVARLAIQYWGRDAAIQMVAIAGAESGYVSNVSGDDWRTFPDQASITQTEKDRACNFRWSHGLYQVNNNAHYTRLAQLSGSSNPCDWATWSHNPSNNTFHANEISSGGTYLVPWSVYLNGAYLAYIPAATAAVDQAFAERFAQLGY